MRSPPTVGPTSSVLPCEIATGRAMPWCRADTGAYGVLIDVEGLAASDFSRSHAQLECH